LNLRLGVRVHNTLLDLVRHREIGRERVTGQYLYVHPDPEVALAQITRRGEMGRSDAVREPERVMGSIVIEVLLEVIQGAKVRPDAEVVAARLAARGVDVRVSHVQAIFEEHGLKKTAGSRSVRSRR
jgi:hypothetical protein